jgi:putative FmdB family regulatory protein
VPTYEFACVVCGSFEVMRPMAEAASPARCPACGTRARRVWRAPGVPQLDAPVRRALDSEERSAHEPAVVASKRGRALSHRHGPSPPWVLSH